MLFMGRSPSAISINAPAAFLLGCLCVGSASTAASSVCLTKKEARHLWPTKHIWWFRDKQTGDRCWSDRRGPPRNLKLEPVRAKPSNEPDGKIVAPPLRVWYPRPFDGQLAALDPPVVLNVVQYRWPGSNVTTDAPIVIEPITVAGADELNELDALASVEK